MENLTGKRTDIKPRLCFAPIAAALILALVSVAVARPPAALEPRADYTHYVTERQVVDLLINQALTAYNAPARVSTPGFTGKLPSNMEIVADRFEEASQLEPYRADLLFSAASGRIFNREIDKAIALYEKILELAPDDIDAHTYLAAWLRYKGDQPAMENHLRTLQDLNPGRANHLKKAFAVIDAATQMPLRDTLPDAEARALEGPVAIVALGYVLDPDGSMNEILIRRLQKTLELAHQLPDALVIVTGGVPHANNTEGKLMAQWLIDHGLDASRIYQDNFARTTVENALYSRYALSRHRIKTAVLTSSATHVRRAQAIYTVASWETGPTGLKYLSIAEPDKPLAQLEKVSSSELRGIYRDVLKTMGLWSFRSYPFEER